MEERSMRIGSSKEQKMSIDDVLRLHAGEFGRWQLKHFTLASIAWALEAFHTMVMIFADREPEWRCHEGPSGAVCRAAGATKADLCALPAGSWEWVQGHGASTVAQWGLICGKRYMVGLEQSTFFVGCMLGAGVIGHLSDSFMGRKRALLAVCALSALFGLLTALSPTFWVYTALRLLTGFGAGGIGLCAFVLATEPVGPSKRGVAGMSTFYFFSFGTILLSIAAFLIQSWRMLYVITSLPSVVFLVAVLPFVSESPRWYLVRQKTEKAMEIIKSIATTNGRDLPSELVLTLDAVDPEKIDQAASGTLIDVIRSPLARIRLILIVLATFFCSVSYYGLSLNVVNLKTSIYLSVITNSVMEMPGMLLAALLLKKIGRRPLVVGTMWLSGVFCLAASLTAGSNKIVRLLEGAVGIFGVTATYSLVYIYTAELFPTTVRNSALGCATMALQIGAILAPMVVVLGEKIPFIVITACCAGGGLVALFLPETCNKPLYDTLAGMEEGERAGKANGDCEKIAGNEMTDKLCESSRTSLEFIDVNFVG